MHPAFKILYSWIFAVDVVEFPVDVYSLRTVLVAYFSAAVIAVR